MNPSEAEERSIDVHDNRGPEAQKGIRKLADLIRNIHTAMLTTTTEPGHFRSRPMTTQQSELEDELWFYTDARSGLIDDITQSHQVNVTYVDSPGQRYVSVSGVAHVVRDPSLLVKFWSSRVAEWFPNGPEGDPYLALLRVQLEEAAYWDRSKRTMVKLFGFALPEDRGAPDGRDPGAVERSDSGGAA